MSAQAALDPVPAALEEPFPHTIFKALSERIDGELRTFFQGLPANPLYDLMKYHMGWKDEQLRDVDGCGGKRLRPAVCLLACQASSGSFEPAVPAAVAVELLHNFTLIHDDIEDGDAMRRNRPALWSLCGMPQALNAGDGMHVLAITAMLNASRETTLASTTLELVAALTDVSLRLCEGQYLDLRQQRSWEIGVEEYLTMIKLKAGSLIACAAQGGALMGGADRACQEHYRVFGEATGMAFQIQDDVLSIWGNPLVTGKHNSDLKNGKMTLPLIYAHQQASAAGRQCLEEALGGEPSPSQLENVYAILSETKAREWTAQRAVEHRDVALSELDATGFQNEAQSALRQVASFSIDRRY